MSNRGQTLLPPAGIVAAVLVTAGVLLWLFVDRGLLIVAGLGPSGLAFFGKSGG